jgi:acetate---CoA ligase (ADP-forming) subunit beta
MLTGEQREILARAGETGWVLEPEAKRLLLSAGLDVPPFIWTKDPLEAIGFADKIGYAVVAKIVSSRIVHKSEVSGVITGIKERGQLVEAIDTLQGIPGYEGLLVEKEQQGIELILGAKIDDQFGPVILFGVGGTRAEIYQDVAVRMAPLAEKDVASMSREIRAREILTGYRGSKGVDMEALTGMLIRFSELVMDLEDGIESIDLNPVICFKERCVVADARIMLQR